MISESDIKKAEEQNESNETLSDDSSDLESTEVDDITSDDSSDVESTESYSSDNESEQNTFDEFYNKLNVELITRLADLQKQLKEQTEVTNSLRKLAAQIRTADVEPEIINKVQKNVSTLLDIVQDHTHESESSSDEDDGCACDYDDEDGCDGLLHRARRVKNTEKYLVFMNDKILGYFQDKEKAKKFMKTTAEEIIQDYRIDYKCFIEEKDDELILNKSFRWNLIPLIGYDTPFFSFKCVEIRELIPYKFSL